MPRFYRPQLASSQRPHYQEERIVTRGRRHDEQGEANKFGSFLFGHDIRLSSLRFEMSVNRSAADTERLGYLRRTDALGGKLTNALSIDGDGTAFIDSSFFRLPDSFHLAFLAQIGLELSEDSKHVEECLASRVARVDWLLSRLEMDTLGFEVSDDVLEVTERASQAINSGDYQNVSWTQEVHERREFGSAGE